MTSQIKHKNCHNFGSKFDFDLWFFKKVIFLEAVSLKKVKIHKIRRRSWSAVMLSVPFFIPDFDLLICKLDNFTFKALY